MCEFAEANSTHVKVTQVAVLATAKLAATHDPRLILRRAHCTHFN